MDLISLAVGVVIGAFTSSYVKPWVVSLWAKFRG